MKTRTTSIPTLAAVAWLLAVATPAQAYLDPSTGSMILSAIVGVLATLGLVLKTQWYRLRGLFRRATRLPRDDAGRPGEPADGDGTGQR